jgi:hypothetical protein
MYFKRICMTLYRIPYKTRNVHTLGDWCLVVTAACPDNCHTCTYNSVDDSTICASSSCVARFAQNSGADDKGCEGKWMQ